MRKFIVLMVVAGLLVIGSGCRAFPPYRGCGSFRDCLRSNVRMPADWCWGNCAAPDQAPPDGRINGLQQ